MSEMTAIRIVLAATLAAVWLVVAWLLWRTEVPGHLATPTLSAAAVFGPEQVARAERYARVLRIDLVLQVGAQLLVLLWLARRRFRLRGPAVLQAAVLGGLVYVV